MTEPDHDRARRILALPPAVETDEDGEELHPLDSNTGVNLSDVSPRYIRELARTYTREALETLVEIMRNPTSSDTIKVACADKLLHRGWGSPGSEAELLKIWLEAQNAALAANAPPEEIIPLVFRMPMTVDGTTDTQEAQDH